MFRTKCIIHFLRSGSACALLPRYFFQMHSYQTSLLLFANVSRECNSTAESTFDVNVSRELQLELYDK